MKPKKYITNCLDFSWSFLTRKCVCGKKIMPKERHLQQQFFNAKSGKVEMRFFCCDCAMNILNEYRAKINSIETNIYGNGGA